MAWGPGNFDNDVALRLLDGLTNELVKQINAFAASGGVELHDVDEVMAAISVHLALIEGCRAEPLSPRFAEELGAKILEAYDAQKSEASAESDDDGFGLLTERRDERREVLQRTIEKYVTAAREG